MGRRKRGGLFSPPRHKWLSDIISYKDPESAERAAERLLNALRKGELRYKGKTIKIGRTRALQIARALQRAANETKVIYKNKKNLSPEERREFKEIHKIYEEARQEAWKIYREEYSSD